MNFRSQPFRPDSTDPCFCDSGSAFGQCCGSRNLFREPPQGVFVIESWLDTGQCKTWCDQLGSQPGVDLGVHEISGSQGSPENSRLIARSSAGRVTRKIDPGALRPEINDSILAAYNGPIKDQFGREFSWVENPQVLHYSPGGRYGQHADSDHYLAAEDCWIKSIDRDISVLLYLNEDFEGGELEFVNFNFLYAPRAGDLVFFPSDQRYLHRAHAVNRGNRFAIVSWAAFQNEPRVQEEPPPGSLLL